MTKIEQDSRIQVPSRYSYLRGETKLDLVDDLQTAILAKTEPRENEQQNLIVEVDNADAKYQRAYLFSAFEGPAAPESFRRSELE